MNGQKRNLKTFFNRLGKSIAFWIVAMTFFAIFRYYGISEEEGITAGPEHEEFRIIPVFAFFGLLFGFVSAFIELLLDRCLSKRISIGLNLFISAVIYFFFIIALSTITLGISNAIFGFEINNDRGWWRQDKTFWTVLIYMNLAALIFSAIQIANDKFGKGVFLKMLFGKYKEPKEEKRIFMFLDLKSSTTIAEKLGHLKYSQLIQDCFYDLNEVVPNFEAEIYQYVGDEAVLSWPYEKGLANNNCVALFFAFKNKLLEKTAYYTEKYNTIPEFKAGLHGGVLMVAEVGVVKKEVAYHGDVINTSARIQAECNNHKVPILISEKLLNDLNMDTFFSSRHLGDVLLKGKRNSVKIHTITANA
jgi:adenylate cyclase